MIYSSKFTRIFKQGLLKGLFSVIILLNCGFAAAAWASLPSVSLASMEVRAVPGNGSPDLFIAQNGILWTDAFSFASAGGNTASTSSRCDFSSDAWASLPSASLASAEVRAAPVSRSPGLFIAKNGSSWTDAFSPEPAGGIAAGSSSRISLNVRDANILDVLSVLAVKMGTQVIFLEQPTEVTFRTSNMSAKTTFQLLLQKEALDYLTVAGHYVVGKRERLYQDFNNRMILTRYSVQHISAQILQDLIGKLNIPVQNVTVDVNTQEIWVQGTPRDLGKFLELINTVDRRQNAAFDTGGTRVVRMPVAQAVYESTLWAQQSLLSDLISNTATGAVVIGGVPRIRDEELYWHVSGNISGDPDNPLHILWVEGMPDHISVVRQMISEISAITPP